ncbi:MAG TPA: hypothetical protein VGT81_11110 [Casimicrobiaceae bacterium]|nr:hypothetical protein [Casimicrobiaceae bacterium]
MGIKVNDTARFRIAAISDGFPHYVHLVSEKLFWEMFNDPRQVARSSDRHYLAAVDAAVISVEQHLRSAYDKATMKDRDDYQQILWAVADHSDLTRNIGAIESSYSKIMAALGKEALPHERFVTRLNQLKLPAHGRVLRNERRSWYTFHESILRGYVRLKAEQSGLQLATDVASQTDRSSSLRVSGAALLKGKRSNDDFRGR